MKMIIITMRLYGAFRKYKKDVVFSVPRGSPVSLIKEALGKELGAQARELIMDSVIASDSAILPSDFIVENDSNFSILPPVCGG